MAATVVAAAATMMLGAKSTVAPPKLTTATSTKPSPTFLSIQNLPKSFAFASLPPTSLPPLTSSAIAAAIFSSLSSADAAFAVQQIADIADGDSRGIALLIPIVPAIAWVLYNILQPALNQINKMRSVKGIAIGLGLGLGLASAPSTSAGEVAAIAEAASGDNRGLLLLVPVAVAIAWVLFNILQPALNQINKMRSILVDDFISLKCKAGNEVLILRTRNDIDGVVDIEEYLADVVNDNTQRSFIRKSLEKDSMVGSPEISSPAAVDRWICLEKSGRELGELA
ncbi:hypothetical protein M5K25_011995 [Dendrobium thyrsiflorum]|uniref:Uncharacterized protein n=1 Tax=Dendrobium thyrsiflorum TaxID=117978 RepID=A0ABD0V466_DENTH